MTSNPASPAVAIVCVGMAGSGKTTFMQRINAHLHGANDAPYVINLDPAVRTVPFECNIDIRDSVNYKEVMRQYNLGPNGGILTSLNLFATKIDQVLALLERRAGPPPPDPDPAPGEPQQPPPPPRRTINHIIVDTPGQIEVFVWSASGDILLSGVASAFSTVLAYVIDTPRAAAPGTFMSNMLYACSILYKTKLPMILVCNKTDARDAGFVREWMTDFEAFQAALRRDEDGELGAAGGGYMNSLLNSMSLVLDEFYRHLSVVPVSAVTGQGVDDFFAAVKVKAAEFERDYRPELERRRRQREEDKKTTQGRELERMLMDMNVSSCSKPVRRPREEPETVSEVEDGDDDDDDEEGEGDAGLESGIQKRYQNALRESDPNKNEDLSFARYMRKANVG